MFPIEQEFIKKLPAETQSHVYYVNAQSDLGYELKGKYNLKTNTAVILELNDGEKRTSILTQIQIRTKQRFSS